MPHYQKVISVGQNQKEDVGFPLRGCAPEGPAPSETLNTAGEAVLLRVRAQAPESARLLAVWLQTCGLTSLGLC